MLGNSIATMVIVFPHCGGVIWSSIVKMAQMNMAVVFGIFYCFSRECFTDIFCSWYI